MTSALYAYSLSGSALTTTISLPSLTSTFTPLATGNDQCQNSLYCGSTGGVPLQATLFAWDILNPSQNVPYVTECWPSNFAHIGWPVTGWTDISTLAYPGTDCISGWTTACTRTITSDDIQYPQTWCCPSSYTCAAETENWRACGSMLSTATTIWAPALTPTGDRLFTTFSLSAVPSSLAYRVIQPVLPLQSIPAESTAAATDSSVTTGPAQSSTAAPAVSGLSPGAAAGIGVGTAVGVLALGAFLILFLLRRRRQKPSTSPPPAFDQLKPELPASEAVTAKTQDPYPPAPTKVALSAHVSESARELPATALLQELDGHAVQYSELDSSQRRN